MCKYLRVVSLEWEERCSQIEQILQFSVVLFGENNVAEKIDLNVVDKLWKSK